MGRLVVASNRVAIATNRSTAGGLAVGLSEALRRSKGLWFGWSGEIADAPAERPTIREQGGITYATVDLSQEAYNDYYMGYANQTLWPVFHYRVGLALLDRQFYHGYHDVNARMARQLAELLRPDDNIWVHDYHLIPLGEELRRLGVSAPLGFFLHTPFPVPQILTTLYDHQGLVRSLLAYDLVGFQTPGDVAAFCDYVVQELGGAVLEGRVECAYGGTHVGAFPIGIDTDGFAKLATSREASRQAERVKESLGGRALIIGVDRLDYSKGLPERLQSIEQLLVNYPDNRNRIVMIQISPPSRSDVPQYAEIRREVDAEAGRINGRFASVDWAPIRHANKAYSRRTLAGLYRIARVGLVTPLRDGMNLVAKEYVAAQDPDDPGVLVLSRFAGAAHQLKEALIVNPHDALEVADYLERALGMAREERQARWAAMMEILRRDDIGAWRDRFMAALSAAAGAP